MSAVDIHALAADDIRTQLLQDLAEIVRDAVAGDARWVGPKFRHPEKRLSIEMASLTSNAVEFLY